MKLFLIVAVIVAFGFSISTKNLDQLTINKIQVIGSHNSYKVAIDSTLFKLISKNNKPDLSGLEYSHPPITTQLDLGLRNLEIDVYSDTLGGKYAEPFGLKLVKNQPPFDTEKKMQLPGFKVFHVQDIDFRSHHPLFKDYLIELKEWSKKNPKHEPIFITMNAKDDEIKKPGFTIPEKFIPKTFDALEGDIKHYLGEEKLIKPADIQGNYSTLENAVLKSNWPKLKNARGKFIFVLDEEGAKRNMFIEHHPSLKGRIMFVNALPNTPEAAILILNDPKKNQALIKQYVESGYIVRTRADAETIQARKNDFSQFEAAKLSGAQIISTDYYLKSNHFISEYRVSFENDAFIRKNPLFY
ncbi:MULTISPECIES: phosphatidylinositol-specific phospholipase C1-like protein [unclassified Arcicella]|uniref:phosphatidylinositol-specific phospholipase C1-like protein n=1 Tax=unclassified Arcicella TaxID=2644986 RepID=UPI002867AB1D|nr:MULTISPECIES: phosphatidylinositol-specific phospholipase C1-like protein [unclassified Arcicella]MDR6560241.1 hypothetical protein [Arcicella sp. BE51]MDR6810153.1 hypothetical protein [Arcicella sp. BE140]MDR6821502.1 hypothetical protein [Arcicella sp. BE139]